MNWLSLTIEFIGYKQTYITLNDFFLSISPQYDSHDYELRNTIHHKTCHFDLQLKGSEKTQLTWDVFPLHTQLPENLLL